MTNLQRLLALLKQQNIEAFLLPINDEFLAEYVAEHNRRLFWVTGFSGSNAEVIITQEKCYFFTDSRYALQARSELTDDYEIYNIPDKKIWELATEKNFELHYDPSLVTKSYIDKFKCKVAKFDCNPVDRLWKRGNKSKVNIIHHDIRYSGISSVEKCKLINLDHPYFITDPESICWLLNIRGNDAKYTPIVLSRAILYTDKTVKLFVSNENFSHEELGSHIEIYPIGKLVEFLANNEKIYLDENKTSEYYVDTIGEGRAINVPDPVEGFKACKNDVEIQGAINASRRDSKAVIKFLLWIGDNIGCTEMEASNMLLKLRSEQELFQHESFETISAFGPNGAVIHYHPSKSREIRVTRDNLYLFDSGGQYLDGTTDVTRTICLGKSTKEQIFHYTLVLKAHVALASAVFPIGTTGKQLDTLARSQLWQYGFDYKHGTGHGVGCFLSVHEGPQSFSNNVILKAGMIISNEPGLYFEGKYGIRLENLMYVEKSKYENFLQFRMLTFIPFDTMLIDNTLLTDSENKWLTDYMGNCV